MESKEEEMESKEEEWKAKKRRWKARLDLTHRLQSGAI
jgi:hypothetical protein